MSQPTIAVTVDTAPAPVINVTLEPAGPVIAVTVEADRNLFVQPSNPNMTEPGMWVQTGLGLTGSDMTIWVEDGS